MGRLYKGEHGERTKIVNGGKTTKSWIALKKPPPLPGGGKNDYHRTGCGLINRVSKRGGKRAKTHSLEGERGGDFPCPFHQGREGDWTCRGVPRRLGNQEKKKQNNNGGGVLKRESRQSNEFKGKNIKAQIRRPGGTAKEASKKLVQQDYQELVDRKPEGDPKLPAYAQMGGPEPT